MRNPTLPAGASRGPRGRRLLGVGFAAALAPVALAGCAGDEMKVSAPVQGSIVFSKTAKDQAEIYRVDGDATKRMATDGSLGDTAPAWSPDGQFVAYITQKNQLSVIKVDPNVPGILITPETSDVSSAPRFPAWLPNGTISYQSAGKLVIVQPTGKRVQELTPKNPQSKDGTLGAAYAWSPDGKQMVFDCGGDGGTTVCKIELSSGKTRALLEPKVKFDTFDWSPDGTTVVAGGGSGTGQQTAQATDVYVFDADGKHLRSLPQPGRESSPAWSPDGKSIVYASDRDSDPGLWVMDADGTGAKSLVSEAGASSPDWTG